MDNKKIEELLYCIGKDDINIPDGIVSKTVSKIYPQENKSKILIMVMVVLNAILLMLGTIFIIFVPLNIILKLAASYLILTFYNLIIIIIITHKNYLIYIKI